MTDEQFHDPIWDQLKAELEKLVGLRQQATEILRQAMDGATDAADRPRSGQITCARIALDYAAKAEEHLGILHRQEYLAELVSAMEITRGRYRTQIDSQGVDEAVMRLRDQDSPSQQGPETGPGGVSG